MSRLRSLFDISSDEETESEASLVLDGVQYHRVDTEDIPAAYAECPVRISDHGDGIEAGIAAGLVGWRVCDSGVPGDESGSGERDCLRPVCGWWVYKVLPDGQVREGGDQLESVGLPSV